MVKENNEHLQNKEAIIHFKGKPLLTSYSYLDVKSYEHALAFTVAKMMDEDLLKETRDAILSAMENGTDFRDFKRTLMPYLTSQGWGNFTDDRKTLNRRLRTIFHTNMHSSYSAGQWQRIQETKEFLPYLQYMPSVSAKKRDNHTRYYGLLRPVDDPIWQSIFPPNGYGCKCWVKQLTKKQAEKVMWQQAKDVSSGKADPFELEMETVENPRTGEKMTTPKGVHFSFAHNHDRLTALLKLAEDKHGTEFGKRLRGQVLKQYTGIQQDVFFRSNANEGHVYPKDKFVKLLKAFDKLGIPYLIGEEGGRFARQMGAEAIYYPTEEGISGFFAFPDNPTRTQVIEELLHYGQHKKTGFASLEWKDIVQFEIEAQKKLLVVGQALNWSKAELEQIERALAQWQKEWEKLNDN